MYFYKCKHKLHPVTSFYSSASASVMAVPEDYHLIFHGICRYCGKWVEVKPVCKLKEISYLEQFIKSLYRL